jgi:hypothetical protein
MTTTYSPRHRSLARALPDICPWCDAPNVPTTHRMVGLTTGETACRTHALSLALPGERVVPIGAHVATLHTLSASPVR